MAVILDTNALSAFADGDERLLRAIDNAGDLAIPAIVLGEYLYGVGQSRLRQHYERWLKANLSLFDLLVVGRETAAHYAEIRAELKSAGRPIPSNDIWIAALAREWGGVLASCDRHFESVHGLRLVVW